MCSITLEKDQGNVLVGSEFANAMDRASKYLFVAFFVIIGIYHVTCAEANKDQQDDTQLVNQPESFSFAGRLKNSFLKIQKREAEQGRDNDTSKKKKRKNNAKKNERKQKKPKRKEKSKNNSDLKKKRKKKKQKGIKKKGKAKKGKKKNNKGGNKGKNDKKNTRKNKKRKNKDKRKKGKKNKGRKKNGKSKKKKKNKSKKGGKKQKKKKSGSMRQECGPNEANLQCFLNINSTFFFEANSIENFLRQYARVNNFMRFMESKLKKKDNFKVTALELDVALGGNNGTNISCEEHNANNSAVFGLSFNKTRNTFRLESAKAVYDELNECGPRVELFCNKTLNETTKTEMDRCKGLMETFKESLKDCNNASKQTTAEKCACYSDHNDTKLPALKKEGCNSFMANLQNKTSTEYLACIEKFSGCRKLQIEGIDVAAQCASGEVLSASEVDKSLVKGLTLN